MRRDTGESYQEFLTRLAKASGIETPTRADLARLDRKRKKKGSNEDWKHPHDPDARITKMKDGRTHLAHKAEHAVDLETGAIVAVTLQGADQGDTTTIDRRRWPKRSSSSKPWTTSTDEPIKTVEELVTDKGYHSQATVLDLQTRGLAHLHQRTGSRPPQDWIDQHAERDAVYAQSAADSRARAGQRLMRRRGELLERPERAPLRNRRHAAHASARARQHSQAAARACGRPAISACGCAR